MTAFTRLVLSVFAAAVCVAAMSCGGKHAHADRRSDSLTAMLAAVDDSVAVNSPHALAIIKDAMAKAADSLDYYDWYLRLMRYNVQRGVPDTAELRWRQVGSFLAAHGRTPRIKGMEAFLLNAKGSYYHKLHFRPGKAVAAYSKAYSLLFGSDAEYRLPDVCANLGDAYVAANDMPHAAWWYRRALFLADSLKLPEKDYASLYMGLGRIYLNLGDFDLAGSCYRTADEKMELLPLNMQLYFLNNYGNYYYYKGDYRGAEAVFTRMRSLLERNGMLSSYEMYLCKVNMADVKLNLGQTAEARRLVDEAYAYFAKLGDATAIYYCHTIQMGIALKAGDTSAVRLLLDSEDTTATIDYNMVNIRSRYLREYYMRKGDYKAAYLNLCDDIRRNDSLKHNIANMRASEIMMRYAQDTLQLSHQIELQAKDADIHEARLGLYIGVLTAAALALLLLYVFTYTRKRRLAMHMQLMQLRLVNVRSRISPHFIFNVLNNRISNARKGDADELMGLVRLIRANLNMSGRYYVSLKEELDFVKYYASVEGNCVDGGLDFSVSAPADGVLEGVMVPSMFIQILVENAIKHGLKRREGRKRLRVAVAVDEAECRITVTDNGTGFDIRRGDPSSTGTGLKVIRSTIGLINRYNKNKMSLGIRNLRAADGSVEGCEVAITMPRGMRLPGLKGIETN